MKWNHVQACYIQCDFNLYIMKSKYLKANDVNLGEVKFQNCIPCKFKVWCEIKWYTMWIQGVWCELLLNQDKIFEVR